MIFSSMTPDGWREKRADDRVQKQHSMHAQVLHCTTKIRKIRHNTSHVVRGLLLCLVAIGNCGLGNAQVKKDTGIEPKAAAFRAAMPDGLYMALDSAPFLLVEDGEWKDPYEWVERNGIEALNQKFVRGQQFTRFQANTELGEWDKLKLHALSAKDMISSSKILNEIKFDLKNLAPRISSDDCKNDGKDLWNCKFDGTKIQYFSGDTRCNTGQRHFGCPNGIVGSAVAVKNLMRTLRNRKLLQLDADALSRTIAAKYRDLHQPTKASNYVNATGFVSEVFFGPNAEKLLAGHIELEFKGKPAWKRKHVWEIEPKSKANLGYVWDVENARFVYLQDKVRVLSKAAQVVCLRGVHHYYCPRVIPIGLWESAGKQYLVMRHEQHFALWHYPINEPMSDMDRKSVRGSYFEIVELGVSTESASVFFTRLFVATY